MTAAGLPSRVMIVRPPDGGWGWVVVFASFMIHIVADGITYSFGILFVELLEHYKESNSYTSWIGSILVGVTLGAGPISSALVNKYGCRTVTILGSVLAACGCIMSMFAPSVLFLFFSFGVIMGLGFGLIYLPAIVSVTYYFEKRRAFATGIAVCGSGIGTFIFAPFTQFLIETYSWKGSLFILAGLILNCTVLGALMRPLEPAKEKKKRVRLVSESELETERVIAIKFNNTIESNGPITNGIIPNGEVSSHNLDGCKQRETRNLLSIPSPTFHRSISSNLSVLWQEQPSPPKKASDSISLGPMYRKDIFYSASLLNIPQFRSNPDLYTASVASLSQPLPPEKEWKVIKCLHCSRAMADALHQMMDLSLLKDPIFLLYAISNFLTSMGFYVPFFYLTDRGLSLKLSHNEATNLILIVGIANTISRVILGYISDKKYINRLWLYNGVLTLCGATTALSVMCTTFVTLGIYAAIFGATAGAYVSLTSVILVDLLGLDRLTNSFGLLLLFQGVASLIGAPIAGMLRDQTGNYDASFYVMGAVMALSGLMLFCIPCVKTLVNKPPEEEKNDPVGAEYLRISQLETTI